VFSSVDFDFFTWVRIMVRAAGLEPAVSVDGFRFRVCCVYQFRHARDKCQEGSDISRPPSRFVVVHVSRSRSQRRRPCSDLKVRQLTTPRRTALYIASVACVCTTLYMGAGYLPVQCCTRRTPVSMYSAVQAAPLFPCTMTASLPKRESDFLCEAINSLPDCLR
jgi:hypothetical protein